MRWAHWPQLSADIDLGMAQWFQFLAGRATHTPVAGCWPAGLQLQDTEGNNLKIVGIKLLSSKLSALGILSDLAISLSKR